MGHYAGLDVSKNATAICIVDEAGTPVAEGTVPTERRALVGFLRGKRRRYARVGIEAGTIGGWVRDELVKARLPAVLIETRHARKVLAARTNKTDRNDARGIAELMRIGSFRAVHQKSEEGRTLKRLLTVRKLLIQKQIDIEGCVGGLIMQSGRAGSRAGVSHRVMRAQYASS
jgi:transposase